MKLYKSFFYFTLSLVTLLLAWLLFEVSINNSLILPSISSVFKDVIKILTSSESLQILFASFLRLLFSLTLGILIGVILGAFAGVSESFEAFIRPYMTILRTVPIASIIVIVLIVAGFIKTPIIITVMMITPIVYQALVSGIRGVDSSLIDACRLETGNKLVFLKKIYLPLCFDSFIMSILQSAGLGLKALVMAEFLAQTKNSIGAVLNLHKNNLEYSQVFAWTIVLILISLAIEWFVTKAKKRVQRF